MNPLKPSTTLLLKLGSIAVHTDEYLSPYGQPVDRMTIDGLLKDSEVVERMEEMNKLAFLPVKRNP